MYDNSKSNLAMQAGCRRVARLGLLLVLVALGQRVHVRVVEQRLVAVLPPREVLSWGGGVKD